MVIRVTFPSGQTKSVHTLRLLVQTQNAEMKAKHGRFLPSLTKLKPTVAALREEYEIPAEYRTWKQIAPLMRRFYDELSAVLNEALAQNSPPA